MATDLASPVGQPDITNRLDTNEPLFPLPPPQLDVTTPSPALHQHAQATEPPAPETIDERGDLVLVITIADEHEDSSSVKRAGFLVCSRALSRNSTVFAKMLYGNFKEARTSDVSGTPDWIVHLYRDDVHIMRILLKIMHGSVADIPCAFEPDVNPLEIVYKLAVWADKYSCVSALKPWIRYWITTINFTDYKGTDIRTFMRAAWIMWTFADQQNYKTVKEMLQRTLPRWTSAELRDTAYPDDIEVPELRAKLLKQKDDAAAWLLSNLNRFASFDDCFVCSIRSNDAELGYHQSKKASACEDMMLGAFIRNLKNKGLWPLEPVEIFAGRLDRMAQVAEAHPYSDQQKHEKCNVGSVKDDSHRILPHKLATLAAFLHQGHGLLPREECHFYRQGRMLGFVQQGEVACKCEECRGHL